MNQNPPSPEDSAGDPSRRLAEIEQRLKRLQPRPADLDVESILCAAGKLDQESTQSRLGERQRSDGPSRWMTIVASWSCGAIAGALLAAVFLNGNAAPQTTTVKMSGLNQTMQDLGAPRSDHVRVDGDQRKQRDKSTDDELHDGSGWSRSELLVSTQLLELYRISPTFSPEAPLRAGSYVRLDDTTAVWPQRGMPTAATVEQADSVIPESESVYDERDQAPSMNRERLLQELLGSSPATLL